MSQGTKERLFQVERDEELTGEEYLETYLTKLEEHFSYERLSGLPESQLEKEIQYVNEHIARIVSEFPGLEEDDSDPVYQAWIRDKEYSFDPLSKEQVAEMNIVIQQLERNVNRAIHEENIRRQAQRGKIRQWFVDLIDAATPGSRQEMSVNIPEPKNSKDSN